jgi:hypothetical protein
VTRFLNNKNVSKLLKIPKQKILESLGYDNSKKKQSKLMKISPEAFKKITFSSRKMRRYLERSQP